MRPALVLALIALPVAADAFCPSYTLSSAQNDQQCGVEAVNGTNPTAAQWRSIIDLVAAGPSAWGSGGPPVSAIGKGCGKPEPLTQVPAHFPCELFDGIAMQESGWRQFCVPDRPTDQVGGASRTIIAFDCGYGVSQVTSGMHIGESPSYDRTRVAGEALYNLATGASILAAKWRGTQCVGDNQPALIEHWYTATWAYNGQSYKNNPSNPNYDANRGVWNPSVAAAAPYQEKVFGWIEHPYASRWTSVALAYPDLVEIGGGTIAPALSEPSCASPTDCTSTRAVHRSRCAPPPEPVDAGTELDAGIMDAGTLDAGEADAGEADAGEAEGDAGEADAGEGDAGETVTLTPDAGAVIPPGPQVSGEIQATSGCGCSTSTGAGSMLFAAWLLLRACRRRAPRLRPSRARD